ncbi:SRPBCC family protein [Streptomyces sp. AV19]|uniref:SRPBCC family protein n=1 Tax=Streptomyces sp. AV19 TaxID=2793068 RepID=UPI0018FE93B8|nr:SRPBCC family protein [Streptomyces sp. AV19]MBH1933166.1 SRPBCC family protein [Streptomyces sp. AV19]MDG4531883.1 SRPBCC family protein [Streptomyces sp. AV19]
MSDFERTRTIAARPEAVFERACDLDRLERWLPGELHVHADRPPVVTVHEDRTGDDAEALVRPDRDRLRLEWGTSEDRRYTGWLQVAGGAAGSGSEVTVHLSFGPGSHRPVDSVVEEALERSLERLEEQVRGLGAGRGE